VAAIFSCPKSDLIIFSKIEHFNHIRRSYNELNKSAYISAIGGMKYGGRKREKNRSGAC
jgi:hypothetical protein